MKKEFLLLFFLFCSSKLIAQLKSVPIDRVEVNSVLHNGGYTLGIDELYIAITDVWKDEKYEIFKISGYVQNAYNGTGTNDTFDIAIYDSVSAQKLATSMLDYQEGIVPINSLISGRHGMFTIYIKEDEVGEINARFAAYSVRISIKK